MGAPRSVSDSEKLACSRRAFLVPSLGSPTYLERRSLQQALIELSDFVQHGVILDVGCGMKPYEPLLAGAHDRWIGTDNPLSMKSSYDELVMADVYADCLALPFQHATFDTVICTQVIEHVPEPQRAICEIARVLRPGGVLILTAPMLWPLHEEPYDFFRYTSHGLSRLLTSAGLVVLRQVQRGHPVSALGQALLDLHFNAVRSGLLSKLYRQFVCRIINAACTVLDRLVPGRRLALGWAIAAQKPQEAKPRPIRETTSASESQDHAKLP
ncbi:MAG: class I SAM-dependent methyltransferase [Verrucomicrobiae bacterium]|nr:class I SAM-dependent methyltransferase [Verrucomicrobiae bacterium]